VLFVFFVVGFWMADERKCVLTTNGTDVREWEREEGGGT
jgi:hypothetical protein